MALDSDGITHEIRDILTQNGVVRGKNLADQVLERLKVSEKTVYREIKKMVDLGELKKTEYNRANIEYELVKITENVGKILFNLTHSIKNLEYRLVKFDNKFDKKEKKKPERLETIMTFVSCIKQLQKIEARLKILSMYQVIRKDKQFNYIEKKSQTLWKYLVTLIGRYNDSKVINDLLLNFVPFSYEEAFAVNTKK